MNINDKLELYRVALEFYANEETYKMAGNNMIVVMMDLGFVAKEALKDGGDIE